MKRALRLLAAAFVLGSTMLSTVPSRAQDSLADQISSRRYIVIDADTGEVFAEHDAHDEVAIASLTKIFTTIEALERAPLSTQITTDRSDLFDSDSTTMGFGPGETFSLRDLLYGMLLPSGNDAAHAIARSLGAQPGDSDDQAVDRFVGYMNQRIRDMGLTETNLVNPHGLGVPGHYSSAHDIAAFMRYALQYPTFVDIIGTAEYDAGGYDVRNTNKLLASDSELLGGKTGYDEDSGYCLIEVARRDGSTMISVTLDGVAPDVWYEDNVILLDYAFNKKAQREAKGEQLSSDVVSFRDPDAAVIQRMTTPGTSLGAEVTPVPPPSPTPSFFPTPTPVVVTSETGKSGGMSWRTLGIVAAVIVAVGGSALVGAIAPRRRI